MATDHRFEDYVRSFPGGEDAVLREMEEEAQRRDFPIVGRRVGPILEVLARAIGAERIFELGSGYGYSAYWFARALAGRGELVLTDADPENERKARDYLGRAGLDGAVRFEVGDALEVFEREPGGWDVVFCDIDKHDYPRAWAAACERVRPGGLYLCDNVLGFGAGNIFTRTTGRAEEWLQAIRRHNELVFGDERYVSAIIPVRDGVLAALRVR